MGNWNGHREKRLGDRFVHFEIEALGRLLEDVAAALDPGDLKVDGIGRALGKFVESQGLLFFCQEGKSPTGVESL